MPMPKMEPTQIGHYTLLERISHGGMAEVFRAKSTGEAGFERQVALKLLLPAMASDQEFIDMLVDEAKIAGQLSHTNIARIFDLGVADGRYYIVQEYVRGQDVRDILKKNLREHITFEVPTACYIAAKVCDGLYYAHNKTDTQGRPLNVVHRDISPHNILVSDEGEIKIIDFGIAKAEGRATKTLAGLVKGKFAYMSPEQIRGLPVDHRSDVFATGILLHEMLTNQPLFRGETEFETLKLARAANAAPPSVINPQVPPKLDRIVLKALARHVDDRYQSARELRDDLWPLAGERQQVRALAHSMEKTPSSHRIEVQPPPPAPVATIVESEYVPQGFAKMQVESEEVQVGPMTMKIADYNAQYSAPVDRHDCDAPDSAMAEDTIEEEEESTMHYGAHDLATGGSSSPDVFPSEPFAPQVPTEQEIKMTKPLRAVAPPETPAIRSRGHSQQQNSSQRPRSGVVLLSNKKEPKPPFRENTMAPVMAPPEASRPRTRPTVSRAPSPPDRPQSQAPPQSRNSPYEQTLGHREIVPVPDSSQIQQGQYSQSLSQFPTAPVRALPPEQHMRNSQPQFQNPRPGPPPRYRFYLFMAALFVLLLASAATVTLILTE